MSETLEYPIKHPELYTGPRQPWRGVLLYGPPGTGKTFLAEACAGSFEASFFNVSCGSLLGCYHGQSEMNIRSLFKAAKEQEPSIVFIDEIDALASARENSDEHSGRVISELLIQMDGMASSKKTFVFAATNLPWQLDVAILRRFDQKVYVPLPSPQERLLLLKRYMQNVLFNISDQEFEAISNKTEKFSASDIKSLVKEASFAPIREIQENASFVNIGDEENPRWEAKIDGNPKTKTKTKTKKSKVRFAGSVFTGSIKDLIGEIVIPPVLYVKHSFIEAHLEKSLEEIRPNADDLCLLKYKQYEESLENRSNEEIKSCNCREYKETIEELKKQVEYLLEENELLKSEK